MQEVNVMSEKRESTDASISEAALRQEAINYAFGLMTDKLNKNNPAMVAAIARLLVALKRD